MLRCYLFDFMGKDTLGSADEKELLQHTKNIAVKGTKNITVHKQGFYRMTQVPKQPKPSLDNLGPKLCSVT